MGQISLDAENTLAIGLTAVTVCVPISLSEGDVPDWPFFADLVRVDDIQRALRYHM